ncbi:Bifunctional PLP-dependent enzyme [Candidatus Rhodobacter oscarellae]|uniref:cysteine-S-conjugate beta-lyase n=1 Tax=Candidatus Rhodobacter oscarellae TaxID=1675527 RepID=A0A0J9E8Z7_9RHOB|nr:MalY/PatB family protein [Candidatus Rhodobacter lobularis]KMW59267.1 Bifunctional PLP-dependent enzyme [Candidatus Rhodobacter lobularis]
MNFDKIIDRRGTHSVKWDSMNRLYGVSPDTGISMWVADMDFSSPDCVQAALAKMVEHGTYGYYGEDGSYRDAVCWWMANRHGWQVDPSHIFTTHGLVNGTALCLDAFTQPGDGVVLFTPIYHAFARVIGAAGRRVVECQMQNNDGRYALDFDAWDAQMDGSEKMLILCSPHNPGGRVWTQQELEGVAAFAKRHDLVLVSDEIHNDLVFGGHKHIPMAKILGCEDRQVMMTAASKTFNLAGAHTGNVIIADDALRARFAARMAGLGIGPNSFGLNMVEAAYSPEGAAWVDALVAYIDGNRAVFDAGVNAIPGLHSMALESTYLAWVDFAGTGMEREEFTRRVTETAQIAANYGPTFGKGGESFMRFNLGAPRSVIEDAVARLQNAFGDLQ